VLLDDVPGEDDWNAPEDRLRQMVRALVRLQARWTDRIGVLLDAGLPDRRAAPLDRLVDALLSRPDVREQLTDGERRAMDVLVRGLPDRFAALDACGVPETLVHGDFHPGNWRFDGHSLVLLDWGDVCVGHPMLDMSSFEASVPDQIGPRARAAWVEAWSRAHPDADPARASALIPPIAALMRAVVYQRFLDGIEPSERPYHASDVRHWLRTALERAADGAAANADL
jgi:Ser/Thr protein kinase RdoA (MazF antagonist)